MMNTAHLGREATIDDLYRVDGKAEIVGGKLVCMTPTGFLPHRAALNVTFSLRTYERQHGGGYAIGDNTAFVVDLPGRSSFSPDAAWYTGPPTGGKFLEGAPVFAVEVRSEGDYGPAAERALAAKRADYFAAGTLVVWDVDVLRDETVRAYHAKDPEHPRVFGRDDTADAEPAVPGWRMPVDELWT